MITVAFPSWTSVLPDEVTQYIYPLSLWSIIDSYRDNVWLCLAPFRMESKSRLEAFFTATRPYVQGAIVCYPKIMYNVDDALTSESKHNFATMNGTDIIEVAQKAGFLRDEIVLVKHRKLACSYADQINTAIQEVKTRCRFFWELQTRDLIGKSLTTATEFYAALECKPVAHEFRLWNQRTTLFRVHPGQPNFWSGTGAAHSFLRHDKWREQNVVTQILNKALFPCFESATKHDAQLLYDLKLLKAELEQAGEHESRTLFYLARSLEQMKRSDEATIYYKLCYNHATGWAQEKYIALQDMANMKQFNPLLCVEGAYHYDPRRFEVLDEALKCALKQGVGSILTFWDHIFNLVTGRLRHSGEGGSIHLEINDRRRLPIHGVNPILFPRVNLGFQECMMTLAECASRIGRPWMAYAAWNTVCLPEFNLEYQKDLVPKALQQAAAQRALIALQELIPSAEFPPVPHLFALI
jgi:hypothetical protein